MAKTKRRKKAGKRSIKAVLPDPLMDKLRLLFVQSPHKNINILVYIVSMLMISRLLMFFAYGLHAHIAGDDRTFIDALCIFDSGWYRYMVELPGMYQLEPKP